MRKDSRLSFRISKVLSDRIDKVIENSNDQIRDRSELGTKAVQFYLDYIENVKSEKEVMLNAIRALADEIGVETDEVSEVQDILENKKLIPQFISSSKTNDTHPKFDELLDIRDRLDPDLQKELSNKMRDATYKDIGMLYDQYSQKYYLEGTEPEETPTQNVEN